MKTSQIVIAAVLTALFFVSCGPSNEATEIPGEVKGPPARITSTVKILSINLAHSLQDKTGVRRFADWVRSTGAEVVAVQQITRSTDSKPGFDAYSELLQRLDMRGTFAKARYFQGWDSGNALFCMYPLLQSNVYPLPAGSGKVRRSLSFGLFELGLKPVAFASTDLDDDDAADRSRQVAEILSIQKSLEEHPMVVTGNFGERINGKASARMTARYESSHVAAEPLSAINQHLYIPAGKNMSIVSAEKVTYAPTKQNGLLVTIEIFQ
jgi:endonuclease/exonuclease/phosphatase family metal-dependent hydrolase